MVLCVGGGPDRPLSLHYWNSLSNLHACPRVSRGRRCPGNHVHQARRGCNHFKDACACRQECRGSLKQTLAHDAPLQGKRISAIGTSQDRSQALLQTDKMNGTDQVLGVITLNAAITVGEKVRQWDRKSLALSLLEEMHKAGVTQHTNSFSAAMSVWERTLSLLGAMQAAEATHDSHVEDISHANGRLIRHDDIPSSYCSARSVQVWLPGDYPKNGVRYSVLYMQDAQNLFEECRSSYGVTWKASEQLAALLKRKAVRESLIVGIFKTDLRDREYLPSGVFNRLDTKSQEVVIDNCGGTPLSEGYVRFMAEELKPFIDKTYHTKSGQADTFLAGSSMGSLISLHALLTYPDVFGGAACLSTHWPLTDTSETLEAKEWHGKVTKAFTKYLRELLPSPGKHRFWFDHGDRDIDSYYKPYQQAIDAVLAEVGYTHGHDWTTKYVSGSGHNEGFWQARFSEPLFFLLQNENFRSDHERCS